MKSKLTNNPNRPALTELADLLFVPTSILRMVHTNVQEGKLGPIEKYKDSKLAQVWPYVGAYMYESVRLYGYYKVGEIIVEKLFN